VTLIHHQNVDEKNWRAPITRQPGSNPNIEYRNPKQIQMAKSPMFQTAAAIVLDLNFGYSILFRDSCFGFRIY